MPIIIHAERKTTYARLIMALCYTLLVIGGFTMVIPFMMMVSGSFKGKVDAHDYDLLPAFLYDETVLFRRYVEEKYNERMQDYKMATGDPALNFRRIALPTLPTDKLIQDWEAFCVRETTTSTYHLGAITSTSAARQRVIPRNLRNFRFYMQEQCGGDLEVFYQLYSEQVKNWFYLEAAVERFLDRNYTLPPDHNLSAAFHDFKASRPYHDRIYLSAEGEFRNKVRADEVYQNRIERFNAMNKTDYQSFGDLLLSPSVPEMPLRPLWEKYVRTSLHPQFILLSPDALSGYHQFLVRKYNQIESLNKVYKTTHINFSDVLFPVDRISSSPQLIDFSLFLQDDVLLPIHYITLDTTELRWRDYLTSSYPTLNAVNTAHGRDYASFDAVPLPHKAMDYYYVRGHATDLKLHFLTRNYKMVMDYITIYGKGLNNTIIYCLLAILSALTVNPLAAYALSRYNLPSQYKILLFFIATIAFPGMVTMIPGYLLLKDLGLLNTFAALVLPGLANGYAIFLLKGFFDSLPKELYEAADMDGASEWFKFWRITMNLSQPILAVIALGAFTAAYGNFMYAFVLCQDSEMWTLMVWLYQLQYYAAQGVQFASLIIAAVPTLLVFVFAQRIIIRGIVVPVEK